MLSQQAGSLLKDLFGDGNARSAPAPGEWLKPAIQKAEQKKARAFRATRVDLNPTGRRSTVQSAFVVQHDDGNWQTIWSHSEAANAATARAEAEAKIKNDPQVKAALESIKTLGLANEGQFDEAIRFGAATMAAQQSVDDRFTAFRETMLKRLDGPPLWWGEQAPGPRLRAPAR
jgi:hypothetical protein